MKKSAMCVVLVTGMFILLSILTGSCPANTGSDTQFTASLFSGVSPACNTCHGDIINKWVGGVHALTQGDVATELAGSHAGETPQQVIQSENCIACHGPTAVVANGSMSESNALGYFFTTLGGTFTADTVSANVSQWPGVGCTACHSLIKAHGSDATSLDLFIFNSKKRTYNNVLGENALCGQCHGNLQFSDTDHLAYNAWNMSKHSQTQQDVATELAGSHAGETPQGVIQSENCIACHGPTAVLANGGINESKALAYFFTTKIGKLTANTRQKRISQWAGVGCTACHDPHNPKPPAYFNSTTKKYETVTDTSQLCGQCHGNLRFPDTDHLSYNIEQGTGGVGVQDLQTMPGVTCTDCHMYTNGQDGSNSTMYKGHTFKVIVTEPDRTQSAACTNCHSDMDAAASSKAIADLKNEFQTLDSQAQDLAGKAGKALEGVDDPVLKAKLDEGQKNLSYAESDESGGFHNHNYLMVLLNDAIARFQEILSQTGH